MHFAVIWLPYGNPCCATKRRSAATNVAHKVSYDGGAECSRGKWSLICL